MISFDPVLAKKYGVNEAIILERLRIVQNKNKENFQLYYSGKHWCEMNDLFYNEFFYFLGRGDFEYAVENLKNLGGIEITRVSDTTLYSIVNTNQDALTRL